MAKLALSVFARNGQGGLYETFAEARVERAHIPRKGEKCALMPGVDCEVNSVAYDLCSASAKMSDSGMVDAAIGFVVDDPKILVKLNRYQEINWVIHYATDEADLLAKLKKAA